MKSTNKSTITERLARVNQQLKSMDERIEKDAMTVAEVKQELKAITDELADIDPNLKLQNLDQYCAELLNEEEPNDANNSNK